MGKALWQLVENAQRFPRRGGRVLCVHGAVSFHGARPWATRWLPGRGARRESNWTAASSDCGRDDVHIRTADLYRPNARFTPERQRYQVLTPFGKLGYSPKSRRKSIPFILSRRPVYEMIFAILSQPNSSRAWSWINFGCSCFGLKPLWITIVLFRSAPASIKRVYPGFPTIFSGLLGFFVGDFMGKALWQLVENAQRFPRRGGRVLCVHGAVSFHGARPWATRWLPGRGARRDVELDRCVLGLRSGRCSHQNRRPVQTERSIYPGKTEISGTYALWETRI